MAFEKILDLNADTTKKLDAKGDKLQGYYLGFKTNTTPFGVSKLHIFNTEAGNVGTWGSTMLDDLLSRIKVGTMTLVQYQGKETLKGGRSMKKYEVAADSANVIDVTTVATSSTEGADSADVNEDYAAEAAIDIDEEFTDEAPRGPLSKGKPAAFGAAHAKQVNNLLNKK